MQLHLKRSFRSKRCQNRTWLVPAWLIFKNDYHALDRILMEEAISKGWGKGLFLVTLQQLVGNSTELKQTDFWDAGDALFLNPSADYICMFPL